MRLVAPIIALASLGAAPAEKVIVLHATGTFEVKVTPEAEGAAPPGGVPTGRMGIAKTFSGDMAGTATGTMLSAGAPSPGSAGAYVAIDQFSGTVAGRQGGFLLLHRGTMDKAGTPNLTVISPDTGTGALAGIAGTFAIEIRDGKHFYDLAYTLPR